MDRHETLKLIRQNMEMSQEVFARKLRTTARTVSRWETGKTQPSERTLAEIGSMLGLLAGRALGAPSRAYSNYVTLRMWANQIVGIAIYKQKMVKPTVLTCADCGGRASYYDHRDYFRPLDLEPVCAPCNRRRGMAIKTLFHPVFWQKKLSGGRPKDWEMNNY